MAVGKMIMVPLERQAETPLPTPYGTFRIIAYADQENNPMPHIAMVSEKTDFSQPILVRIHSECMTGDVFGSLRCDCGEQLQEAMRKTGAEGGVIIYLRQEGRGIGLINKMKAYNLQDKGLNTAEANLHLGFEIDARDYDIAVRMLKDLEVKSIKLMTNNPEKVDSFISSGIELVDRVPLEIAPREENYGYLQTKQKLMGHMIDLPANNNNHH
ncbi:GTP cyclohydrolase II [Tunicatimonas pelagia]|uniref:GTP cyclohydrolase II n=1 Tax=Tunicatimonas pelagia TaxID=931531 RepID=UPI0026665876|nr:GTP cyclohydrolase II [Tunicatimonas pelagia]WKN44098.1 GTP cyclohydrolase II [Tunicatimonas pelagia]